MNIGIILTFLTGLFIVLGALIGHITNKSKSFVEISISMAFSVMILLSVIELFPEAIEYIEKSNISFNKNILLILFVLLGIGVLKGLDLFVPDHDEKNENKNLYHIGIVSSIALLLHNIIEGMTIYESAMADSKIGILMTLGVGLHNIPMGIVIYSTLSKSNNSKKKKMIFLILLSLSTLFGGTLMYLIGSISDLVVGILLSLTLGMIIYITLFELLHEIIKSKNKKMVILGLILGIVIFMFSLTFE